MLLILIYILGVSVLLINILGPRTFIFSDSSNLDTMASTIENSSVLTIGHITVALFLVTSLLIIFFHLARRNFKLSKQGLLISTAGLLLYFPIILSAVLSQNGGFSYKLFFFPLFIITAYLSDRINIFQEIPKIIPILLIFIYTSLLGIILNPTWAYTSYTQSWIGIPIRLFGVSNHPNGLGYIVISYFVLIRFIRKKNFWFYINFTAAIITLILSQSKTAWGALLVWLIIEGVIKLFPSHRKAIFRILAYSLACLLLVSTYILLFQKDLLYSFLGFYLNLSGRIDVWQITLETWLDHPLIGYGPNLWDVNFRQSFGYLWAGQSHNQFLQTLGETGLLGFIGLLYYLNVLIKFGSRYIVVTNYSSLGIIVIILIRSFSESPLRNYSLDESFLFHAIFFVILINSESLISGNKKFIF